MAAKILDFESRAKAKPEPCRHSPPWAIDSRGRVTCRDCGRTLSQVETIRVLAGEVYRLRPSMDEARGEAEARRLEGLTGFLVGLVAGWWCWGVLGLGR
jgi:hypothetical protein